MSTRNFLVAMVVFFFIAAGSACACATGRPTPPPTPEPEPCCGGDIIVNNNESAVDVGVLSSVEIDSSPTANGGTGITGGQFGGRAFSNSTSGVYGSGNSRSVTNTTYRVPMRLITSELLDPVVGDDVLYPELDGQTVILFDKEGNPVTVTFAVTPDTERVLIAGLSGNNAPNLLDTAQNHGKTVFARLSSRDSEFVGPMKQAQELLDDKAPAKTKGMLVRIKSSVHTRGTGGVGSVGHDNGTDLLGSVAGNMAGSYYLSFPVTYASFYDGSFGYVNCNRDDSNPLCEEKK